MTHLFPAHYLSGPRGLVKVRVGRRWGGPPEFCHSVICWISILRNSTGWLSD